MEKDKLDEDNSSRELDDFIAADKSSNTVKNTKYKQVDGNFNGMNIPCALNCPYRPRAKCGECEPDSISSFS